MSYLSKVSTAPPRPRPPLVRSLGVEQTWGFIVTGCIRHDGSEANRNWSPQRNYALNFILHGTGRLQLSSGSILRLAPGVAYQHFPGSATPPQLLWDSGQRILEWYLSMDARLFARLHATGLFPAETVLNFTHPDPAGSFAAYYERLLPLEAVARSHRLHLMLAETVFLLGRLFDTTLPPEPFGRWSDTVKKAREWLDLNPASRDSLPQLARRLGVSYAGLRRLFQAEVGQSLTAYRVARRIEEARSLLVHNDVSQTAAKLGYSDPFTFSTQFKKITGQSPRSYQRGGTAILTSVAKQGKSL